jgi:quercetin dioxygenase-like cupin family protein
MSGAPPPDDPTRELTLADPEDPALVHLAVVGDTYTFLVTGTDTAGRYALIDMLIPPGGGPPPHRHDFEEMFHVLEGEIEVTLREATSTAGTGVTVNIPANAPHRFHNATESPVRLLCLVSPRGWRSTFSTSATRCRRGPRRRRSSARRTVARGWQRPSSSRHSTGSRTCERLQRQEHR